MDLQKLFDKAHALQNNGQIEESVSHYQRVRDEALKQGANWLAAESLHMQGVTYYQDKQNEKAMELLSGAEQELRELEDQILVGAVLRDQGMVLKALGRLDEAQERLEESIKLLSDNPGHLGISQVKVGVIMAERGDLKRAIEQIKVGLGNIQNSPERFFEALAFKDLGKIYQQKEELGVAKEAFLQAMAIVDRISSKDQNLSLRKELQQLIDR